MTTRLLVLAASAALAPAFAAYTYDYANLLNPYSSGQWIVNGNITASTNMLTSTDPTGGSLIWNGGSFPIAQYEVRTTLTLLSSGGSYVTYLRANSDSLLANGNSGVFYAIELANPVISGGSCWATLNLYRQVGLNNLTLVSTNSVPCHNGMVIRSVVGQGSGVLVYLDNAFTASIWDGGIISLGQPGVGVSGAPAGNGISAVDIGHGDTAAPSAIDPKQIGTSSYPNHVDFQFPGAVDDPIGIGVAYYQFWRDGNWINMTLTPQLSDTTVSPGTTYTYLVQAVDYHSNSTSASVTVTTPAAGAIDPRRIGVNALGAYWGASGEQIDTRSGNLNFTLPLLSAQGRGGWAVPFALSYNSQNWRQDLGGTWQLGRDIGFGYGWRMQAGSITPVYSHYWSVEYYLYIDSTGAEYRLDIPNNGVWTSKQGIYVSYDAANQRLYFPDGSFWTMGCMSMGSEADAGTLYPTQMTDTNGNLVALRYAAGIGAPGANSSARLLQIEDVRAVQYGPDWVTYDFQYSGTVPHLSGIVPRITSAESATFGYTGQNLADPFSSGSYGTTTVLSSYVNYLNLTEAFTYNGSGEMLQASLPYGGTLRWDYDSDVSLGSRRQREVLHRYLRKGPYDAETTHTFYWDGAASGIHPLLQLNDGTHQKQWSFNNTAGATLGVLTVFTEVTNWSAVKRSQQFTWTTDANGTPYVAQTETTLDWGTANAKTTRATQTIDTHGNLLTSSVYDYAAGSYPLGQPGPLLRTYTNTYLSDPNYTSRYIFNRLVSSVVSGGGNSIYSIYNQYDQYFSCQGNPCGSLAPLIDLTNPAPRQHDTTYNASFLYRGNVTTQTTPVKVVTRAFDIGGNARLASYGNLNVNAATGSATNYAAPSTITPNGNGQLASSYTFAGNLELTRVTMPNGDFANQDYYAYGMPSASKSPYGATTNYAYSLNSTASTITATTNGHWVKSTMDGLGRTTKVEKGDGANTRSVTESVYGPCACTPMGKVVQVSLPHALGATALWTVYTYDGLGRTLTIVKPDNSTTAYLYTGNITKVTDAASNWKQFTTDALGNLTQVTEPDPQLGNVTTNYTYNLLNKLTQVQMARNGTTQTRTFTYDQNGQGARLLSATNPENGTVQYTYNADGTLATRKDAKNQTVQYSYDSYQRLTQVSRPDGTHDNYTYDGYSSSGFLSLNALGRLAAVTFQGQPVKADFGGQINGDSSFTYMYSYTQAGLVTAKRLRGQFSFSEHGTYTPSDLEADYTYDEEGRLLTLAYPMSGPTFTYGYNAMGQPNTLSQTAGTSGLGTGQRSVVTGATYGAAGEMLQMLGLVSEYRTYNNLFQLTSVNATNGGTTYVNMQYTYPAGANIGKISTQKNVTSGEEVQYAYDSLGRLVSAQTTAQSQGPVWGYSYVYDGFGNLNAKNWTQGSPSAGWSTTTDPTTNHAVATDANGNALTTLQGGATYDVENRLISSAYAAGADLYGYDPSNKRIQKTLPDGTNEIHFYGAGGERLGVYKLFIPIGFSATYTSYTANLSFAGKHLGRFDITSYTLVGSDRLGSETANMYPWGEEKTTTGQNVEKFATYYRDGSGVDYADQRYYSSIMGRFLTPDTGPANLGSPQSFNRYLYAASDPANLIDPSGRLPLDPSICGSGPGSPLCIAAEPEIGNGDVGNDFGPVYSHDMMTVYQLLGVDAPLPPNPAKLTFTSFWDILLNSMQQSNSGRAASTVNYFYPTKLVAIDDSCTLGSIQGDPTLTNSAVRRITYQVFDQYGRPWGAQDGSLTVNEIVTPTGGTPVSGTASWSTSKGTISPTGTFLDNLSVGGVFGTTPPGTANQVFYGSGNFSSQPLRIQIGGQTFGVLGNYYASNTVLVNGIASPGGCK